MGDISDRRETVTYRATDAGWTLPRGFTITAWLEHDHETEPVGLLDSPSAQLTVVHVEVLDQGHRVWGAASQAGCEYGEVPGEIDTETGAITTHQVDPLINDQPLSTLMNEALRKAQLALNAMRAAKPFIVSPARAAATLSE